MNLSTAGTPHETALLEDPDAARQLAERGCPETLRGVDEADRVRVE